LRQAPSTNLAKREKERETIIYALACIGSLKSVEEALLRTVEHCEPQTHDFEKAEREASGKLRKVLMGVVEVLGPFDVWGVNAKAVA
jgi:hypothetical protein